MTVQKVIGRCAWYLLALPIQIRRLGQQALRRDYDLTPD
jgi:hypothetical protein